MKKNEAYEAVIGLEIHIELATQTKIFCGCSTRFGARKNSLTCPVCMGMPGALPTPNKRVAEYAIALGLAVESDIQRRCRFDRKNYYYPDNPQNYQISQLYIPICKNGKIRLLENDKIIRIHEIHMEEDAGKLIHKNNKTYIDYNRAGVPLLELVTEPDMRSSDEVIEFIKRLRDICLYLGISDCKMNEGSMRVDVNLSVRKKENKGLEQAEYNSFEGDENGAYGVRTEMKNLNSFRSIVKAIESEKTRQIKVLESGGRVILETRRWDDDALDSFSMRTKETMADYRYFPEPDIPDIFITDEIIERVSSVNTEFREQRIKRYVKKFGLSEYDAGIITESKRISDIYDEIVLSGADAKMAANLIIGENMRLMKEKGVSDKDLRLGAKEVAYIISLKKENKINSNSQKRIFTELFSYYNFAGTDGEFDVDKYIDDNGLRQLDDAADLEIIIKKVLSENEKSVEDFRAGKKKALGFLVGQTMKETKGAADPARVNEILSRYLG